MSTIPANTTCALRSSRFADDPMRQVTYRLVASHWRKRKPWLTRMKQILGLNRF